MNKKNNLVIRLAQMVGVFFMIMIAFVVSTGVINWLYESVTPVYTVLATISISFIIYKIWQAVNSPDTEEKERLK